MKKKWKIILGAAAAVVVLAVVIIAVTRPLKAEMMEVQPESIARTVEEEGIVTAGTKRPVYPSYGGEIVELPVEEGEKVKNGDLLAVIDSQELKLQLKQLQAELKSTRGQVAGEIGESYPLKLKQQSLQVENAEQELESARSNYERMKQLYEADAVSKSAFEEAEKGYNMAKTNLEQQKAALSLLEKTQGPGGGTRQYYSGMEEALQAQVDLIRYKIENNRLNAPIDGTVSELNIEKGTRVTPGAPAMNIIQQDSYEVEVYVLAEDVHDISTGMEVELVQERNDKDVKFKGKVTNIAPSAVERMSSLGLEERRVKVTIAPQVSEKVHLRPGYSLDVEFTVDRKKDQLVVPKTALFSYEDGDALWVVRNNKAEIQPVEKGFENDRDVAITDGLKEGDQVILDPQLKGLEEGTKVK